MRILVILGHPSKGSFNHALAETVLRVLNKNRHEIVYHDLYAERFEPALPAEEIPKDGEVAGIIEQHCDELQSAEGIVIIHPNWWGQPPAILKGWIDRVFRPGVAYEFEEGDSGEGIPIGLLKAGAALVFNTSNTPQEREVETSGDPLETLWRVCIFALCGVRNFHRQMFGVMVTSSPEQRGKWLDQAAETIEKLFPSDRPQEE
jgi:putative NADPH-quinone reductase